MSNDTSLARGFRLQGNERVYTIEEKLGQGGFGITYRVRGPVKVGNIRMTVDFALKEFFLRDDCERLDNSSVSYSNRRATAWRTRAKTLSTRRGD